MIHNEDSRVKLPAVLHLCRLGYNYLSLKNANYDSKTNIFTDLFLESIARINPEREEEEIQSFYKNTLLTLENNDLGQAFFKKMLDASGIKMIDFEDFNNNSFHVVTELTYKNGDEEFRPDITLLINGLPLAFIEVKIPNNRDGIIAERTRINKRFRNKKFRKFFNITQLMVFSNNMEYDDFSTEPYEGAFYASSSYSKPVFNYFREEENFNLDALLKEEDDELETEILKDNNYIVLKHSVEFIENKNPKSPTNRICTSLFQRERLAFLLRYAFAYVEKDGDLQKHIMRYPQIFATKAIHKELDEGTRKGIIWHTQGSGKTALTYFNVKYLSDYFSNKNIVPKFYFIVDRLDLLEQASSEFRSRGLLVHNIKSKQDFMRDIKTNMVIHNNSGQKEITVVNIHKFDDDKELLTQKDYNINVQRIYFMDEVHRSYNPKGSFLANLNQSDKNAIQIGLTGTPLLSKDYNSRQLFGKYIHKYYYNKSIADGYTLRLIREEIETKYKIALEKTLEKIEVLQGDMSKKEIYAHESFVQPMLKYIIEDFELFRKNQQDNSVGAMVVCDSSDQAKQMFELFNRDYADQNKTDDDIDIAADGTVLYASRKKKDRKLKTAALILHDVGTKQDRKDWVRDFKEGKIDILFVFNMLLTGFDAPCLKKLYLGRVIKRHNLLQTLTRVNRTYKSFRYGYVVDFADIKKEFDATNKLYFDELQQELGDEFELYSDLFKSKEEMEQEIEQIKDALFHFDTLNAEIFSQQISQINSREQILGITKALSNLRELYNMIRLTGHYELMNSIDFEKMSILERRAKERLHSINQKEAIEQGHESTNLLNMALEDIIFDFRKVSEEEMIIADELKETLRKTREALASNFDKKDAKFVSLREELERLFKKKNLSEITQEEMAANIDALNKIYEQIKELNRLNNLLKQKYQNDQKYARIHKRLMEKGELTANERKIFEALNACKISTDEMVLKNTALLNNESFFNKSMMKLVVDQFKNKHKMKLTPGIAKNINALVVKEYLDEFFGRER